MISLAATHRLHVAFELARQTTTSTGKLFFRVAPAPNFERSMIRQGLNTSIDRGDVMSIKTDLNSCLVR